MRKIDKLLVLIAAQFMKEEKILLLILDKSMTKEQFEKEIIGKHE
jgi:hypothetical protein